MIIRSWILQWLLLLYTFISVVESGGSLVRPFANEKNGTCALLMYGNVVLVHINLCGNRTGRRCPYVGGSFTAWIDVTKERTLQVWLNTGSWPQVQRPLQPLIQAPNFTLPIGTGESLFFRGSSCEHHYGSSGTWSFDTASEHTHVHVIPFSIHDQSWKTPAVGGNAVGGMVATFVLLGFFSVFLAQHHTSHKAIKDCLGRSVFTYKELCTATKQFSRNELLGKGGLGTVYRGCLERFDNTLIAVKRIRFDIKYVHKAFRAEISCLSEVQHENIVDLLGWCQDKCRLLLVYAYMSNGSLHEWIHGNCKCKPPLLWKVRQSILKGVASGIEYLHTKCQLCILHRNIKSSNVLLDGNFVAHLGDFGLDRLLDNQKQYKTIIPKGYLEYMAPEMPYTGIATKESDVYSFGILILEVICGRHPLDKLAMEPEELVLLYICWHAYDAGTLLDMADPKLFPSSSRATSRAESPISVVSTDSSSSSISDHQRYNDSRSNFTLEESTGDDSSSSTSGSHIYNDTRSNFSVEEEEDVQVKMTSIKNLLHLGLLCCVSNPKERPTIGMVLKMLDNIGYIDDLEYVMANIKEDSGQEVCTPMKRLKDAIQWCMTPL